jgi:hypothetical protein
LYKYLKTLFEESSDSETEMDFAEDLDETIDADEQE